MADDTLCQATSCFELPLDNNPYCLTHQYLIKLSPDPTFRAPLGLFDQEDMLDEVTEEDPPLSVAEDSLDQMVEAASVPDLSTLFQRAKDAGLVLSHAGHPYSS